MSTTRMKVEFNYKDLKINYGERVALESANLSISGNVIAVIGHNGAGKSTLLKTLLGLTPFQASSSTARYYDGNTSGELTPSLNMAFCPEYGAVFEDIDVESYIKFWCRVKCFDSKYYCKEGSHFIDSLRISPLLGRLGRELSKGERRRVQTAIGFLTKPKAFIFDEPFCGLDIHQSQIFEDVIRNNLDKTALMISSHRMDVVERLADSILVLSQGRVIASGDKSSVALQLCSNAYTIQNACEQKSLVNILKSNFQECYAYEHGSSISVIGNNINHEQLATFVASFDRNGARVMPIDVRLGDALGYLLNRNLP